MQTKIDRIKVGRNGWIVPSVSGNAAIIKVAPKRYNVYSDAQTTQEGWAGTLVAWRPTLKEATSRATWAGLLDLTGSDSAILDNALELLVLDGPALYRATSWPNARAFS